MIDNSIIENLKKKYVINPLLFHRSVEYAKDFTELFDILDTMPKNCPIIWDINKRRWIQTNDITQSSNFGGVPLGAQINI
jgi:hypothetical protein